MLDYVREETALEAKRRELASMITEGRQVVAALSERRTAIGRKIDEALEGIQRLQDQITAIDTVAGMVSTSEITFQPPRPIAPVLEVVATVEPSTPEAAASRPQSFRPVAYLKCVADGHDFMNSRSMPGHITCRRCRMRRSGR